MSERVEETEDEEEGKGEEEAQAPKPKRRFESILKICNCDTMPLKHFYVHLGESEKWMTRKLYV